MPHDDRDLSQQLGAYPAVAGLEFLKLLFKQGKKLKRSAGAGMSPRSVRPRPVRPRPVRTPPPPRTPEPELLTAAEAAQSRRGRSRETGIFSGQLGSDELIENIQEAGGGGTDLAEALAGSTRNVDHLFGGGLTLHPTASSLAPGGDMLTELAGAKARHEGLIDFLKSGEARNLSDADHKKLRAAIRQAAREHADLRRASMPASPDVSVGEAAAGIAHGAGQVARPVVSGAVKAADLASTLGASIPHYGAKGIGGAVGLVVKPFIKAAGHAKRGLTGKPFTPHDTAVAAKKLAREKEAAERLAREASGE